MSREGITTVIDVGANTGQYALRLRDTGFAGHIASFEPLPEAFRVLSRLAARDPRWTAVNKAVAEDPGSLSMHVAANSVSSSLLPVADAHRQAAPDSATVNEITVECTTMYEVIGELRGESVMIKADTQGFELPVLRGARTRLSEVRLVELELSLAELYSGQALFREVDAYLLEQGFALKSLEEGFFDENTGELLQVDAVYCNLRTRA